MALVIQCMCLTCGKSWTGAASSGSAAPTECHECTQKKVDIARREHFSGLDGLTLEERVRKLENWIYNYRPPSTFPMKF